MSMVYNGLARVADARYLSARLALRNRIFGYDQHVQEGEEAEHPTLSAGFSRF